MKPSPQAAVSFAAYQGAIREGQVAVYLTSVGAGRVAPLKLSPICSSMWDGKNNLGYVRLLWIAGMMDSPTLEHANPKRESLGAFRPLAASHNQELWLREQHAWEGVAVQRTVTSAGVCSRGTLEQLVA